MEITTERCYMAVFKGKDRGFWAYAPHDEDFACDKVSAIERHAELIDKARRGELVDGLPVTFAGVVDARQGPMEQTALLSQYPDDETPVGPWMEEMAA